MIRVLFINHSSSIGGAETNLLNLVRFSDLGGFRAVGVLLPQEGPLVSEVRKLGVPVGVIRYYSFKWRNPARYLGTLMQLVSWVRRTRADVIHLNHQWLVEYAAAAGRLARKPVICHTRNFLDQQFVSRNLQWLNRTDATVVESHAVERRALALGLRTQKIKLIFNSVDVERFKPRTDGSGFRREWQIPENAPVVGFSGRIVPEKGPEDLVHAVPAVLRILPEAHFCFVGDDGKGGSYVAQLLALARDLNAQAQVHFLGFRSDIEKVLREFTALVVPSRLSMPEGLPLTALEGLAAGCLVIATPNSGLPEVIRHNETGYLIPPEDPDALASTIIHALSLSPSEVSRIRHAGRSLVSHQFAIDGQVRKLGDLYRGLAHD